MFPLVLLGVHITFRKDQQARGETHHELYLGMQYPGLLVNCPHIASQLGPNHRLCFKKSPVYTSRNDICNN